MLKKYVLIAVRNLRKGLLFTCLNLFGLSLGLAIAMLLLLYVLDEWSFDRHLSKGKDLYRINLSYTDGGESFTWATAPSVAGPIFQAEIPEIKSVTRFLQHEFGESGFVTVGDKKLVEEQLFWADNSFISLFDLKFTSGKATTALDSPNKIILSLSTAQRYFGEDDPVGKTLALNNQRDFLVTGVFEDLPANGTLIANAIGSFSSLRWAAEQTAWGNNASFETFVWLDPEANVAEVEKKMAKVQDKYVAKNNQWYKFSLQPFWGVHLYSNTYQIVNQARIGDIQQVRILFWLALVVLALASINYMNLSTARAQQRFKEVGVNKTLGAKRGQLALRFYTETGILVLLALLISLLLIIAVLPWFNQLANKNLGIEQIFQGRVLFYILGVSILLTLLAGAYPALLLSGFDPKNLLHTSFRPKAYAGWIRRGLVIVQFTVAVALMTCTYVFRQQLQFIQQYDLGFNPDQVLALTISSAENQSQINALIEACKLFSEVKAVSTVQSYPGRGASVRAVEDPKNPEQVLEVQTNRADHRIVNTMEMKLLAGQNLPVRLRSEQDTTVEVLINKKVLNFLGYASEDAIGKRLKGLFAAPTTIVGVVADFNNNKLNTPIGGYVFHNYDSESLNYLLVKMKTKDLQVSMKKLRKAFAGSMPNSAFEYKFLDQHLDNLYRNDERLARVVSIFSILSILIACLGLFGLAAYTAEQRTKEIGVRKVLGASSVSIIGLLSKDFLRLVLIAVVLAAPLAWYVMSQWLKTFAYHIELHWSVFVATGLLALVIAFLTVSLQSLRAAQRNPVESLKLE